MLYALKHWGTNHTVLRPVYLVQHHSRFTCEVWCTRYIGSYMGLVWWWRSMVVPSFSHSPCLHPFKKRNIGSFFTAQNSQTHGPP